MIDSDITYREDFHCRQFAVFKKVNLKVGINLHLYPAFVQSKIQACTNVYAYAFNIDYTYILVRTFINYLDWETGLVIL